MKYKASLMRITTKRRRPIFIRPFAALFRFENERGKYAEGTWDVLLKQTKSKLSVHEITDYLTNSFNFKRKKINFSSNYFRKLCSSKKNYTLTKELI